MSIEKYTQFAQGEEARIIELSAAQIASPDAQILRDTSATFKLNVPPHTRHYSDGSTSPLPVLGSGGGGGASLTNITAAALAALTSGTASATTLYRVTDGTYRGTVYAYDATSDTLHPVGLSPILFGYA